MKLAPIACAASFCLPAPGRGAGGSKTITKTTISLGTATAGQQLSGLWQCIRGNPECGRSRRSRSSRATPRAPTKTSRCWNPTTRHSAGGRRALLRSGRTPTKLKILTAMYSSPACSWCAPTGPTRPSRISSASRSRCAPRARACRSCRAAVYDGMSGRGFQVDLSRSCRRWPRHGAGRPCGRAGGAAMSGRVLLPWRKRPAAHGSLRPTPARSRASAPSIHS